MKYTCRITALIILILALSGTPELSAETTNNTVPHSGILTDTILDLKTAGAIALKDNPSVAAAQERISQAREKLNQARSGYWPSIDLKGSAARVTLSDADHLENTRLASIAGSSSALDNPDDHYQAGVQAAWLLFDGFRRTFAAAGANYGLDMTVSGENDVKRLLLASVADAYFTAQLARETIAIAEADREFYSRQLEDAKARQGVGAGSLSDVLNFEVRVNSANADLIRAKRTYEASMYGLAALLGIQSSSFPDTLTLAKLPDETTEELAPVNPEAMISYALSHRPDLLRRKYSVDAAGASVKQAYADFYPRLSLSASYAGARTEDSRFGSDDFGNTIALNLSYNLFSGGIHRARLLEAKSVKREAESENNSLIIQIRSEVRRSVAGLESARRQLALQRSNARLVKQNRDLVETEYAAGQSSLVRLNEAQRDLTTASSRLVRALVSMRQARYRLATDTGRIGELFELK